VFFTHLSFTINDNKSWWELIIHFRDCLLQEELEDTKGRIRISKSTDRQHNGQRKKDKRTNNDKQHITHNHNIVLVFMQHTLYLLQYNTH
jgi:hypothetical protein